MKTFRTVLLIAQIVLIIAMVFLLFQSVELRKEAEELNKQVEEMDSLHNAYMGKLHRIRERMVVDSIGCQAPVGIWRTYEGLNRETADTSASNYATARRFYSMFIGKDYHPTDAALESLAVWLKNNDIYVDSGVKQMNHYEISIDMTMTIQVTPKFKAGEEVFVALFADDDDDEAGKSYLVAPVPCIIKGVEVKFNSMDADDEGAPFIIPRISEAPSYLFSIKSGYPHNIYGLKEDKIFTTERECLEYIKSEPVLFYGLTLLTPKDAWERNLLNKLTTKP